MSIDRSFLRLASRLELLEERSLLAANIFMVVNGGTSAFSAALGTASITVS